MPYAQALNAELGAALAARHAALEFERRFSSVERKDAAGRELFEVRVAEARLKDASADPLAHLKVLAPLAAVAAEDLERVAAAIYPYLAREVEMAPTACLQALLGLQRLARIDEARTRAVFTAARQSLRLPGFEDAVDLAVESEQLFLAMRRFEELLDLGHAWEAHDVDWLLLRCSSVPGRLRLRATALRALAHELAGLAWNPAQMEALEAYGPLELRPETALAWAAAGFSPEECVDWRKAGLKNPAQAHAWHCHGFDPQEALDWSQADLLPDESGIYVQCGAETMQAALELRQRLGDVQHFFAWYHVGMRAPEVLRWLKEGVRSPEEALKRRSAEALNLAMAKAQEALSGLPAAPMLSGPIAEPGTKPSAIPIAIPDPEQGPAISRVAPPAQAESWAQQRARERLGLGELDEAAARVAAPAEGGAWMAWGCLDAQATIEQAGGTQSGYSLPMGGGLFDLVMATEGVAVPGRAFGPKTFEPEPEWQERLDRLRELRRAPRRSGAWHLAAWPPLKAVLAWGLVFQQADPPWSEAMDFLSAEPWKKRWARKTEEWGEEGLAAECEVLRLPGDLWAVAIKASQIVHAQPQPSSFEAPWPSAAWREQLQDFCLKMEIPKGQGHWQLLASAGDDPKIVPDR